VELEVLVAYDSTDDLSNIDINNFDDIKEFSVGKAFKNWDQVADFIGCGRVNAKTKEIIKQTYLCCYAGKPAKSSEHVGHELNPLASQFDPTLQVTKKHCRRNLFFDNSCKSGCNYTL
ncbi:1090_t:CDS:2, partial [Gigaspora rosea]